MWGRRQHHAEPLMFVWFGPGTFPQKGSENMQKGKASVFIYFIYFFSLKKKNVSFCLCLPVLWCPPPQNKMMSLLCWRLHDSQLKRVVLSTWLNDIMSWRFVFPNQTATWLIYYSPNENNKVQGSIDFSFCESFLFSGVFGFLSFLLSVSKAQISQASIPLRCSSCLPLSPSALESEGWVQLTGPV